MGKYKDKPKTREKQRQKFKDKCKAVWAKKDENTQTIIIHGQKQRRKYKDKHKKWAKAIYENAKSKTLLLI